MKRVLGLIVIINFIITGMFIIKASAQVADNDVSIEMDLPSGWSMISLPVIPCNASISSLFPKATVVYGYEKGAGYVPIEELEFGRGYWILLDQNESYTLTGQIIQDHNQIVYEDEWRMIGGCTLAAKALADNCSIGVIYKFVQGIGYQRLLESQNLEPCKGYWILLRAATYLSNPYCERVVKALDGITTSLQQPFIEALQLFFTCIPESQTKILTETSPANQLIEKYNAKQLDLEQCLAINEFKREISIGIRTLRGIKENNNELLFFRNDIVAQNYDSPYIDEIDSSQYGNMWKYPEFDYKEYRKTSGERTIIRPFMTLNKNQTISLEKGRYFFESLTLEEGSTLTTNGAVEIYVISLKLEKGAQLIGKKGDEKNPNRLLILADYWEGFSYDPSIHRIMIGPSCEVYGHIFAPRLEVYISSGSDQIRKHTNIRGFILTRRLVTYSSEISSYMSIYICNLQNSAECLLTLRQISSQEGM